jgi:hypothetical protein
VHPVHRDRHLFVIGANSGSINWHPECRMKSRAVILAAMIVTAAPHAGAQVFKCKSATGTVVYQDGPCEGAAVVDTRGAKGVSGPQGGSASRGDSPPVSTKPTHPVVPEKMRR